MHDSINGFIIYPTYRIVEDEKKQKSVKVYLFGRLENGESFLTINTYKPYFYIKKSDVRTDQKFMRQLELFKAVLEESDFKDFDDEKVVRITLEIPGDTPKLRKILEEEFNMTCYEADIRFYQRFLIDHDIKGSIHINGTYKKGTRVDRIYEEATLRSSTWKPELKVLSFDIETDAKAKNIYCISLYTEGLLIDGRHEEAYKNVFIVGMEKDIGKELRHAVTVNSEEELLKRFQETIQKIDPDIITGWNSIDFDFKVLKERFDHYKLPFILGRTEWPAKLEITNEFMRDSSIEIPGRMVLDGIPLLKMSYIKLENYKLETAAQTFLGESKLVGPENKGKEIEDLYHMNQQKLVDYNLKDAELVYKIVFKTHSIQLTIQRALITGMTLDRVKGSVASLDSLFLRYARKHNIVLNSAHFAEKDEPGKGGFVMDSKPGLYEYVIVCDFKSLYPSIIRTFNIDPYSYVDPKKIPGHLDPKKYVVAANGAVFKNQEGILPKVIEEVWIQRDLAKKRKDTPETIYGIKIIMNSFYGVLGNPACRFYNPEISNAITHTGQQIIKLTTKKVEEMGYEVIYGDTDSVFINTKAADEEGAEKIGKKIQKHINEFYNQYIKETYHRDNIMELQFEKLFKMFLMPTVRGSEEGAKKRYAGLLLKKNDDGTYAEEVSFTGMEFVRGDWTDLAKKFQMDLFELVFKHKEVAEYIKKFIKDLKSGKYDDMLVYKKNINKPLSEYTKTTPPHVKAARQLKELTSSLIQYVVTVEGPEPVELLKHKPDYDHYIDKQLKPIADTILFVYDKNFDDFLKGSSQKNLFGY